MRRIGGGGRRMAHLVVTAHVRTTYPRADGCHGHSARARLHGHVDVVLPSPQHRVCPRRPHISHRPTTERTSTFHPTAAGRACAPLSILKASGTLPLRARRNRTNVASTSPAITCTAATRFSHARALRELSETIWSSTSGEGGVCIEGGRATGVSYQGHGRYNICIEAGRGKQAILARSWAGTTHHLGWERP
jgi:hypothetical protein